MIPKPRMRLLTRDGDADKAVVTFFAPDGNAVKERLVMVSNLIARDCGIGVHDEMARIVNKSIREFGREVAAGYW